MKRALVAVLVTACGGRAAPPPATAKVDSRLSPAQIAEMASPSIVLIKTPSELGTGFAVWNDRVATNLHVIAGAREAVVILPDGREFKDVQVLGVDPAHDLAVLRVPTHDLKPLKLGDSTLVKAGERVVAIGHPLGLGTTVSDGLVSAVRVVDPKVTLLQITAPISPGSSGGPLFNEHAEVIGVATLIAAEGQNVNFGVPVAYLKPLLLAEQATPLAALAGKMDVSLLDGCSIDDVKLSVNEISDALKVGVPKYNKGDPQGCFDAYQAAALKLVGKLKQCKGIRETLLGALSQANQVPAAPEKAWALRHAFDRIMSAVSAAVDRAEGKD